MNSVFVRFHGPCRTGKPSLLSQLHLEFLVAPSVAPASAGFEGKLGDTETVMTIDHVRPNPNV